MTRIISTNIKDAEVIHFDGRDVYWLQKVQENCPNFSSVCTCIYKPGARAKPAHAHLRGEETIYVMSGSGKVKVGEVVSDLQAGTCVLFPQGVPHMVWNCGAEDLHIICFYAPNEAALEYEWHEDFDFPEFLETK